MSRIHLKSNSLVFSLALAAAVAGAVGVGCSSSGDDTTDTSAGAAGKSGGTSKAGASAGGGDTSPAAGESGVGEAGTPNAAGGSGPIDNGEGGAAGTPTTPAGGSAATGGSSGDNLAASIARGKAKADQFACTSCHQVNYAGAGHWPNITPDPDNGIGDWTDDEIKAAITMQKDQDGSPLCSEMVKFPFNAMEVTDVVAYLRSLPANTKKITQACVK